MYNFVRMTGLEIMKNHCKYLWGLVLLLGLSGCIGDGVGAGTDDVQPGDPLPGFQLKMEDGSLFDSRDLQVPSLIVFFHTGCPDCQQTLPEVQRAYENYGDALRFVAISREQKAEAVRAWWDEQGITLPFSAQNDRKIYGKFASSGIPRVYISDSEAVVRFVFDDRPCPSYADLAEAIGTVVANL